MAAIAALALGLLLLNTLLPPGPGPQALAQVDREMAGPLQAIPAVARRIAINAWTVPLVRMFQARSAQAPAPLPAPQPVAKHIPGPPGAPDVGLLIVDPAPGTTGRPAFLHMHGDGYVLGSPWQRPALLQAMAVACGCVVVSVDYRLAPEHPFPAALEDNYAALGWVYENAQALGIDRDAIAIGGESAGAGHAAMLAIAARDRGHIPVRFQVLIYPMLDDRTGTKAPADAVTENFIWTAEKNRFGWTSLLGVPAGAAQVPPGSVPARVANLAGLAPAFIGVGELDLFLGEDIAYAERLRQAGVPVELATVPAAFHGFDVVAPDAAASVNFRRQWMAALGRAYAR